MTDSAFSRESSHAILLEQLRQQVGNLMAALHLLTPAIREGGDEKNDQYLAIMNQSFYRLLRLMNHMEFTQDAVEGGIPFRSAPLDLAGLCRETADQVTPLAKLVGVSFRYESELSSLLTLGDGTLLRRLLLGLFSNALKAAGEGGEAGLHLTRQKNRALLTIWDNGVGLCDEDTTARYHADGGMGLGLPIVRELCRLHGGAVMLESRAERGTRAVVSLPITPPTGDTLHTPAPGWDPAGGFSPVLVELAGLLPYHAFSPDDVE